MNVREVDNEERLTILRLLERLKPFERTTWLVWCAKAISRPGNEIVVTASNGTVREVFYDWLILCETLGLDWRTSRDDLELRVRKTGTRLFWRTQPCPSLQ